jgi:Wings apart-like protein regulation of heterochromatin
MSFLRICINLTNSNGETCEALNEETNIAKILVDIITQHPDRYYEHDIEKDSIKDSSEEDNELRESRFELLLLGLGLMINLVQESARVHDLIRTTHGHKIETIFDFLTSKEVYSHPTTLILGTRKSCIRLSRTFTRPFNRPSSKWKRHASAKEYKRMGKTSPT